MTGKEKQALTQRGLQKSIEQTLSEILAQTQALNGKVHAMQIDAQAMALAENISLMFVELGKYRNELAETRLAMANNQKGGAYIAQK